MPEQEARPPRWGPIPDPAPFPWDPIPWPPWDPTPWPPWQHDPWSQWRRIPRWPPGDPPNLLEKLSELIKPGDLVALQQARLEMTRAQLAAQLEFTKAQTEAQLNLLSKQMEILAKYRQSK